MSAHLVLPVLPPSPLFARLTLGCVTPAAPRDCCTAACLPNRRARPAHGRRGRLEESSRTSPSPPGPANAPASPPPAQPGRALPPSWGPAAGPAPPGPRGGAQRPAPGPAAAAAAQRSHPWPRPGWGVLAWGRPGRTPSRRVPGRGGRFVPARRGSGRCPRQPPASSH